MKTRAQLESGIGLVEVMIALAIILFTALSVGSLQTSGMLGARMSSVHFSLNHLSSEMLETLRAHRVDAGSGLFDFDGASSTAGSANSVVSSWNDRIAMAIPTGEGSVVCASDVCEVFITWVEEIDGSNHRQRFRAMTPL